MFIFSLTSKSDLDLTGFEFNPELDGGKRYQEAINALPWSSFDVKKINKVILDGEQVIKCQYNYGVPLQVGGL